MQAKVLIYHMLSCIICWIWVKFYFSSHCTKQPLHLGAKLQLLRCRTPHPSCWIHCIHSCVHSCLHSKLTSLPPGGCWEQRKPPKLTTMSMICTSWLNSASHLRHCASSVQIQNKLTFMHVQHKAVEMNPLFLLSLNIWIKHVHHHSFSCAWKNKEHVS